MLNTAVKYVFLLGLSGVNPGISHPGLLWSLASGAVPGEQWTGRAIARGSHESLAVQKDTLDLPEWEDTERLLANTPDLNHLTKEEGGSFVDRVAAVERLKFQGMDGDEDNTLLISVEEEEQANDLRDEDMASGGGEIKRENEPSFFREEEFREETGRDNSAFSDGKFHETIEAASQDKTEQTRETAVGFPLKQQSAVEENDLLQRTLNQIQAETNLSNSEELSYEGFDFSDELFMEGAPGEVLKQSPDKVAAGGGRFGELENLEQDDGGEYAETVVYGEDRENALSGNAGESDAYSFEERTGEIGDRTLASEAFELLPYEGVGQGGDAENSIEQKTGSEGLNVRFLVETFNEPEPHVLLADNEKSMTSRTLQSKRRAGKRTTGRKRRGSRKLRIKKESLVLPQSRSTIKRIRRQTLRIAKPPKDLGVHYESGTDEAELEEVINQEITQLYNLLKTSNRRDLRLRLGQLYVEKADWLKHRIYADFDKKMTLYRAGKIKTRPRLRLGQVHRYTDRAIKLHETYRKQFPRDRNMDQVLYFLGRSYTQRGRLKRGKSIYERLVKRYPRSEFITDVKHELGEYYFNESQWVRAKRHYLSIARNRRSRLYSAALFKVAWCNFKLGKARLAVKNLEAVIREGKESGGRGGVIRGASKIHYANEAVDALPVFYSESKRSPKNAFSYFERMSGSDTKALSMLKVLAYAYRDMGQLRGIKDTFKMLIEQDPYSPQSYEYEFEVIRAFTYAGSSAVFLKELRFWLNNFGPKSTWAKRNKSDQALLDKAFGLMENTVRNHAVRMHQSYKKSNDAGASRDAVQSYQLYLSYFGDSEKIDQIHFYYAELFFEMKQYDAAAKQYALIMKQYPNSKFLETASLNNVLVHEKRLPSQKQIEKTMGGDTKKFVKFPDSVEKFQSAVGQYIKKFPNKSKVPAMLYKKATLSYDFNHHKVALQQFWELIEKYPKNAVVEQSGNFILDIHNLRKDYVNLEDSARRLLQVPVISRSKSAPEIRKILSQVALRSAEELAKNKEYLKSAKMYEAFAKSHPRSPLRLVSWYNAGVNYLKGGDTLAAISFYQRVLRNKQREHEGKRKSILVELPFLYRKLAQYTSAADAFVNYAKRYPREKESAEFWYNAALIYDALDKNRAAEQAYLEYFKRSKKPEKSLALYLLAKIKQRSGRSTEAISYYNQFLNRGYSNGRILVESGFQIAEIYKARNKTTLADRWYRRTISLYKNQKQRQGVHFAAQAQFHFVNKKFMQFQKVKIPKNPARQQKVVQQKMKMFSQLKEELKEVIRYDSVNQIVASLVLIGMASKHLAGAITNSPPPPGLKPEELKQYREALKKVAEPFEKEAEESFNTAVKRAGELGGYARQWIKIPTENLHSASHDPSVSLKRIKSYRGEVMPAAYIDWNTGSDNQDRE